MEFRPQIYLDHNVLDYFVKNPENKFLFQYLPDFRYVFSLENIREIKRSKGFEHLFTAYLDSLEAKYLDVLTDENHRITDNFRLQTIASWDSFLEENPEDEGIRESIQAGLMFSLKLMGGLQEISISEIIEKKRAALKKVLQPLMRATHDELIMLGVNPDELNKKAMHAIDEMEKTILSSMLNDKYRLGIKAFRENMSIGPQQLNNITGPDVVTKIWEMVSKEPFIRENNISIERLAGMETNYAHIGKPFYDFEKAMAMYGFLNWIGYFQDTEITKEKRFIASNSDTNHVGYGIYANVFMTFDERLHKKASAAFEYLKFNTVFIKLNK